MFRIIGSAIMALLVVTGAQAQDKLDFTVGDLKWRCQHQCDTITGPRFVSVKQSGDTVSFTDSSGKTTTGKAKTAITQPSQTKSLRCQMDPSYCSRDAARKPGYYRSIEIPAWSCAVSVQQKDAEPNTPPPFKAQWLRFASKGCAMGTSIWTTLSPAQVKALERKCGPHNINC